MTNYKEQHVIEFLSAIRHPILRYPHYYNGLVVYLIHLFHNLNQTINDTRQKKRHIRAKKRCIINVFFVFSLFSYYEKSISKKTDSVRNRTGITVFAGLCPILWTTESRFHIRFFFSKNNHKIYFFQKKKQKLKKSRYKE